MTTVEVCDTRNKNKAWGESVYEEEGVKIKDLCQSMGYEVINTSLELTENEDHILAQIIKKYWIQRNLH